MGEPGGRVAGGGPRGDGELVPLGLRASAAWTWRIVVVAGGVYLLLLLLAQFKVLVVPVLVALLVVALIKPLTELGVRRLRLAPALAAVITSLLVLLALAGLIAVFPVSSASRRQQRIVRGSTLRD